jgi:hypothetical protein
MTSARRIAANRRNACKSRGPRTEAGKACASRNAFRHGLASVNYRHPDFGIVTERIAKSLCGEDGNPLLFEQALVIAEGQVLLRGVRTERVAAIERLRDIKASRFVKRDFGFMRARARFRLTRIADAELTQFQARIDALDANERDKVLHELDDVAYAHVSNPLQPIQERDEFEAMHAAIPDLNRLERYERRAWSRLRRAIARFMSVKLKDVNHVPVSI